MGVSSTTVSIGFSIAIIKATKTVSRFIFQLFLGRKEKATLAEYSGNSSKTADGVQNMKQTRAMKNFYQ